MAAGSSFVHGKLATLRYRYTADERTAFTFVVSGKAAPRAVDRNLLKRRGRAILRTLLPVLSPGYLCAFFFKKEAVGQPYRVLSAEIRELLTKARILKQI